VKRQLWLAAATLLVSASASASEPSQTTTPTAAATAEMASQAISVAEAAAKRADEVGFEWRDTDAHITKAKEAAEKQDYGNAVKLANKATHEGNMAYAQYESQQKNVSKR
jgi:hypothetical protein